MIKTLQNTVIFMNLLLAADGSRGPVELQIGEECTGVREMYRYTEDYSTEDDYYCLIPKEYYDMLPGMDGAALANDRVIVELEHLYTDDDDPRKWIDCVINYSSKRKDGPQIDKNVFLGTAIYAQYYRMQGEQLETLIDNLFRLYIRKAILNEPEGFHSKIYQKTDMNPRNTNFRDEIERLLLEKFMKNVLAKFSGELGIPMSVKGYDLKMHAHEEFCTVDELYERRNSSFKNVVHPFKNVVMERLPIKRSASASDKIILLTLIGLIRSGRHTISAECRKWFVDKDLGRVIKLVNTNQNLAGVTELDSSMNLRKIFGNPRDNSVSQLRYLEIQFAHDAGSNNRAIDFIRSLGEVKMKIAIQHYDSSLIKRILGIPNVIHIKKLLVRNGAKCLTDRDTIGLIADSENVEALELWNCGLSLEEFLAKHYEQLRDKLKVLKVAGVGDLRSSALTELLGDLALERLEIRMVNEDTDKIDDMSQLGDIIAKGGFKWLVLSNVSDQNMQRIADLKRQIGEREWPVVIVTRFNLPETGAECYSHVGSRYCTVI